MDHNKSKKLLACMAAAYWLLVILIFAVAHPQFRYTEVVSDALTESTVTGELVDGMELRQNITVPAQKLTEISLLTATYGRQNSGVMTLTLADLAGEVIAQQSLDISAIVDNDFTTVALAEPLTGRKGETLQLLLTTQGCAPGNAVTFFAGSTISTGRFDIAADIAEEDLFRLNDQPGPGKLCIRLSGTDELGFYKAYWPIVTAVFAAAAALAAFWWKRAMQGRNNPLVALCTMLTRYSFLIRQLVGRDFKTKYKRSVLGMAWSFLNPLLTMCVQYIVFSTLFKSSIPYFAVYLLTGIVFMNFFTEAVSMCMTSITGNAALIKKVYMPKYIYPVSRVISSLVNFVIALIPLFLVMLLNGLWPRPALLLLVFDIICLLGFVVGMGLLLTTAMTFFQDTQFLWGVISMMWMYLTPIFYPESIIAENLLPLYRANPMYQFITFARTCIIDGVSPEPLAYLWCILSATLALGLGIFVFKKNQDRFVLYL